MTIEEAVKRMINNNLYLFIDKLDGKILNKILSLGVGKSVNVIGNYKYYYLTSNNITNKFNWNCDNYLKGNEYIRLSSITENKKIETQKIIGYKLLQNMPGGNIGDVIIKEGSFWKGNGFNIENYYITQYPDWFEPIYEKIAPEYPELKGSDGKIYKGVEYNDYIKYGCAHIDKRIIKTISNLNEFHNLCGYGNRFIQSIVLSSGVIISVSKISEIKEVMDYYEQQK